MRPALLALTLLGGAYLFFKEGTATVKRPPNNFSLYRPIADKWLRTRAVPPELWNVFYGMIMQESGWNPDAFRPEPQINDASYGLGQMLLGTAYDLGFRGSNFDLYDPDTNLKYVSLHFLNLWMRYKNVQDVLAAYNSGRPMLRAPKVTVEEYVPNVLALSARIQWGPSTV